MVEHWAGQKVAHWAAPKAAYLAARSAVRWVVLMASPMAVRRVGTSGGS